MTAVDVSETIALRPSEAARRVAELLEGDPPMTAELADHIDWLLVPLEVELIRHRSEDGSGCEPF